MCIRDSIYAHLDYTSKLSSAKAMVSGMALPESVNFGSKWAEISADDGKNWFFSVRIRQNAENRLVLSKKQAVLSIVLSRFWANEQKRKVQQTRMFTGLSGGELGIRTLGSFWEHSISSAAPSTTRTTLRVCNSAFLPKTFGKNWRKEQQNIQFSNRRKPLILRAFLAEQTANSSKNFELVPLWSLRYVFIFG